MEVDPSLADAVSARPIINRPAPSLRTDMGASFRAVLKEILFIHTLHLLLSLRGAPKSSIRKRLTEPFACRQRCCCGIGNREARRANVPQKLYLWAHICSMRHRRTVFSKNAVFFVKEQIFPISAPGGSCRPFSPSPGSILLPARE